MRKFLFLNSAQRFSDFALLLMRLFVGLFLIWGVWDNITDAARMQEFASFLAKHEFASPKILAPVSVYLQLAIGLGFVLGPVHALGGHLLRHHFRRSPLSWSIASTACAAPSRRAAWSSSVCTWPRTAPVVSRSMRCSRPIEQPRANGGVRFRT